MRFIHLADLHLGKKLKTIRGDIELDFINPINQIKDIIKYFKPNFLFISGDIFHYKNPSQESEQIFIDFLLNSYSYIDYTFIISGNHDNSKILSNIALFNKYINRINNRKVFICTDIDGFISLSFDRVDVLMIPFLNYRVALNFSLNKNIPENYAYSFIHGSIIKNFLENSVNSIKFVLAHFYVEGSILSGDESKSYIDSIYYVKEGDLDVRVVYYALGHIHRYQKVGYGNVYYSGSIIPLDFGEDYPHGIILGEIQNNFPILEFCKLSYKEFVTIEQNSLLFEEIERNSDKFVKVIYKDLSHDDFERLMKYSNVVKLQKKESKFEFSGKSEEEERYLSDPFNVIDMYLDFYKVERKEKVNSSVLTKLREIEKIVKDED